MRPQHQRRVVLIDTRFQLRMAAAFILLQVFLTGIFALALYAFMDSELKAGLASAHAAYRSLDQMLLPLVLVIAGFNLAVSVALVTGFVVLLSHRIAGPLHRFRVVMEELAGRRIPEHAHIRPTDQLGVLSEATGRALEVLQADMTLLRSEAERTRSALAGGDLPATGEALAGLEATLARWLPAAPRD